jgi:hypothetical protein
MKLPELGVQKPVATLMFFLAIFLLGAVMATQLPVDLMPEIERPTVTVVTTWEGVSAADVESMVTKAVERALGTVNGLEEMTSATIEGISSVTCEFAWGTNLDEASNDIRSNLERIRKVLPEDADPPMLRKFNTSQIPIQFYGITCAESIENLEEIANNDVADPLKAAGGGGGQPVRRARAADQREARSGAPGGFRAGVRPGGGGAGAGKRHAAGRQREGGAAGLHDPRAGRIRVARGNRRDRGPVRRRRAGAVARRGGRGRRLRGGNPPVERDGPPGHHDISRSGPAQHVATARKWPANWSRTPAVPSRDVEIHPIFDTSESLPIDRQRRADDPLAFCPWR